MIQPEGSILVDGMLIDVESGEILAFEGPDRLAAVVQRRSWAKIQTDKWESLRKQYDVTLLHPIHGLPEQRMLFADIDVAVAGRQGRELDGRKLAELLAKQDATTSWDLYHWIASASGFRTSESRDGKEFLTPAERAIYDQASRFYDISWITTTVRREEAPESTSAVVPKARRAPSRKSGLR